MYDPVAAFERERAYLEGWRPFYHPVATLEELDTLGIDELGRPRVLGLELLGERIVLARLNGQVAAMHGTCPHRSTGLAMGWVSEAKGAVQCRYHGFEWGADGRLAGIPALEAEGRPLPSGEIWRVPVYPCQVKYGLIWVCLEAAPLYPVLEVPEAEDASYVALPIYRETWRAGCGRMMEAALDNYHFAFTHVGTLGDPSHPEAPKTQAWIEDGLLLIDYHTEQPLNESITSRSEGTREGYENVHYQMWARPNAVRFLKTSRTGHYCLVIAVSPIGPQRSRFFRLVYRDFDRDTPDEVFSEFATRIDIQDQEVVETMRPWELSTDLDAELQAYMDRPTVTYRKWLAALGIEYL